MLDATRKKLREASFFLRLLSEQERRFFKPEPEAFDFYLSAFLSAARSVGDVIEAEEHERYRTWSKQRRLLLTKDEDALLKFTKSQRIQTVHVRGANVETELVTVPITELQREIHSYGGTMHIYPGGVPGEPAPMPTTQRVTPYFEAYPDESVAEVCSRYLSLLSSLVSEYEQHIAPPNNSLKSDAAKPRTLG